jgi:hypothetical protein
VMETPPRFPAGAQALAARRSHPDGFSGASIAFRVSGSGRHARKAEGPGTKRCRMMWVAKIPDNGQRDFLEHVVRVGGTNQRRDERAKGPVETAKEYLQGVLVAMLGEGDEDGFAGILAFGHRFIEGARGERAVPCHRQDRTPRSPWRRSRSQLAPW